MKKENNEGKNSGHWMDKNMKMLVYLAHYVEFFVFFVLRHC